LDVDGPVSGVDWSDLPAPVATRLVEIASEALTTLAPVDIPAQLRPVVKFAPAKRARLAASALLSALREHPPFRAAVLLWAKEHRPNAVDPNATADPVRAAAAATLLGNADAGELIGAVARQTDLERLRAERDAALVKVERLAVEVERLRGELAQATAAADKVRGEGEVELERLRGRLREQGVRVRRATQDSAAATAALARAHEDAEKSMSVLRVERDRERDRAEAERRRADRAEADAEVARQAAREARAADEVRLSLLVDTLAGAVTGLRRELALGSRERGEAHSGPGGPRPADLVRGASRPEGSPGRVEDPAALDRLLALPAVHLVVDGYNVTKTGYPELTLSGQRDRLVMQLSALAARTSAEVTVVFDGAGVVAVPTTAPRGVRVLFSDPGVLADDVIRAVVAAEPEGRPVVVVTSDRAVADSVRRRGAHPVPSPVLLARLTRV